jgi:rare lipoprotein A (peptidoglycan hydrolase)
MSKEHLLPRTVAYVVSASAFAAAFWATARHTQVEAQELQASTTPTPFMPSDTCTGDLPIKRDEERKLENVYFLPGELDSVPDYQEGLAHSYGWGEPLNERTSSGERFDPTAMTAASWFYPLGMKVRVTDILDGDSLIVTINDRGPNRVERPDVIIDLTRGVITALEPGADRLMVSVDPICQK